VAQRQAIEPARPHVEPPPIRRETPHVVAPSEQQATGAGPVPRPSAATEPHAATTGTQTPEPMEPPVEAPRPTPRHVPLAPEGQAAEAELAEPSVEPQPIPHETPSSAVQRRAAEAKPIEPRSEPSVKPSLPRSTTPQPVRPDLPVVQRQATQPAPQPSVSVEPQAEAQASTPIEPSVETPATQVQSPSLPLKEVQRQVAETKSVPPPEAMVEPSIEPQPIRRETPFPAVQRQSAEAKPIEPTSGSPTKPLLPYSLTPSHAHPDLPEAQRQPTQPAPRPGVTVEPEAEAQTSAPVKPSVETPATQVQVPPLPLREVQRQTTETEPTPRPSAAVEPSLEPRPIRREVPSSDVQRQVAGTEPSVPTSEPAVQPPSPPGVTPPPDLPVAQREAAQPTPRPSMAVEPQAEEQTPAPIEPSVKTLATRIETPRSPVGEAQRQATETEPALPSTAVTEPRIELPLPSPPPRAPQVQRQATEAKSTPTPAIEPPIERSWPSTPPRSTTRPHARIEQPLVQRRTTAASPAPAAPSEIEPPAETAFAQRESPPSAIQPATGEAEPAPTTTIEPRSVGRRASTEMPSPRPDVQVEQPLVQRKISEPELAAELPSVTADEHDFTLGTQVFARRAASQRLTTTTPPDLPLTRPALRERVTQHEIASMPPTPVSRPEAVTSASIPATSAVIQRLPIESPAIPSGEGFIQRVETTPPEATVPIQAQQPNLDDLARKIYPLVKRMLAVERERRAF
jgi:hypothetical protein